jgi:hypothetical protein
LSKRSPSKNEIATALLFAVFHGPTDLAHWFCFIATGARLLGWLRLASQTITAARGQSRPVSLLKKQAVEIEAYKGVSLQRSLASCIELAKLCASFSEHSEL